VSFWFHAKMFNCTVPGAIAAISDATHGGFRWSSSQSASCVFLCLKSGYLSFVYNQNPDQADQPCILHIPGVDNIIRTEKAALGFSMQIAFTYLLQPATTIPPEQRTWIEFLQSLDQGKITTKRVQQEWEQQELWYHWHVNSDRFDVPLPFLICDPTIVKDPKRTSAIVSLSDLQGLLNNFLSNHVVWSHRSQDEVLRLA
jgi:hypothetical protein